jgi:hypothetical protein
VVACLGPKTFAKASRFVERVGRPIVPTLKAAIAAEPNPELKQAAERMLEQIQ